MLRALRGFGFLVHTRVCKLEQIVRARARVFVLNAEFFVEVESVTGSHFTWKMGLGHTFRIRSHFT